MFKSGMFETGMFNTNHWISSGVFEPDRRMHVSKFHPRILETHGYYCPFCGYRLFYRNDTGYYCNCRDWEKEGDNLLQQIENHHE